MALSPVAAPWWASARSVSTSALIGSGAGCIEVRIGSWADQKSFTMACICSGVPDPRSAFIRHAGCGRVGVDPRRAHGLGPVRARGRRCDRRCRGRGGRGGRTRCPAAGSGGGERQQEHPERATDEVATAPEGHRLPPSPSAARPERGYCAVPSLDSASSHLRRPTSASTALGCLCATSTHPPSGVDHVGRPACGAPPSAFRRLRCGLALAVESFVVRTAVNRGAAVRMMRSGVLLLLLVEVVSRREPLVLHPSGRRFEPCRAHRFDQWKREMHPSSAPTLGHDSIRSSCHVEPSGHQLNLAEITRVSVDRQRGSADVCALATPCTLPRRGGYVLRLVGWRCTGRRASTASPTRTQSTRRADSWLPTRWKTRTRTARVASCGWVRIGRATCWRS